MDKKEYGKKKVERERNPLNLRTNQKRNILLSIIVILLSSQIIISASAFEMHQKGELLPGKFYITKIRIEKDTTWPLIYEANATANVYLVNRSECANFLLTGNANTEFKWEDTKRVEFNLNFNDLNKTNSFMINSGESNLSEQCIEVYILISNTHENQRVKYVLDINYEPQLYEFFESASLLGLVLISIALIIFMGIHIYQYQREGEEIKAKMLKNYSIIQFILLLIYLFWQIDEYYQIENNRELLSAAMFYSPLVPQIAISPLVIITLIGLFLIILIGTFQVERILKTSIKQCYFSFSSILALVLFIIGVIWASAFNILFGISLLIIIAAIIYDAIFYFKIIRNTSGIIRIKTILLLTGTIGFILGILLRPYFYYQDPTKSNLIGNIISIISIIAFYYGVI